MPNVTRIKLALAIMGIVIFAAGIRMDNSQVRVIAIAFLAAAFALRFVKPRPPQPPDTSGSPSP